MGNRLLTAERDEVIAFFKFEQMNNCIRYIRELPYDQGYKFSHLIQTVTLPLNNTLLSLTSKSGW